MKYFPAKRARYGPVVVALSGFLAASLAPLEPLHADRQTLGWVEYVTLEPWGVRMKAKLDTGAKTSSLHAENVRRFERSGDNWVSFNFTYETDDGETRTINIERPIRRNALIKQHSDSVERRAVVNMDICINGEEHTEQFTLVDRSRFIYPVLLGRRALRDIALVDAGDTFMSTQKCASD